MNLSAKLCGDTSLDEAHTEATASWRNNFGSATLYPRECSRKALSVSPRHIDFAALIRKCAILDRIGGKFVHHQGQIHSGLRGDVHLWPTERYAGICEPERMKSFPNEFFKLGIGPVVASEKVVGTSKGLKALLEKCGVLVPVRKVC